MLFQDFTLSQEIKQAIVDAGYEKPTEIQERSIPLLLEGRDVIGFSQTGSGKTAAFGLPLIDSTDLTAPTRMTQGLILCPTRELAMQAKDELTRFAKYKKNLHIVAIYGGDSIEKQIGQMRRGCQIIVGTPGRVMDHMRRHTLKLDTLRTIVLDEADEMLNMGFREDIETILAGVSEERQTVLFSATMPQAILDITDAYQHEPELIKIKRTQMTVSTIEQSYFDVPRGCKKDAMSLLLQYHQPKRSIVFCNTKKMVDELVEDLEHRGYSAQGLHGDMQQNQRTTVMNRFKRGHSDILVATDVAARGIDVSDVDVVFNFDIPNDTEYYVHRIGRTGRAGREGKSFTLISGRGQYRDLMRIADFTKSKIVRQELPRTTDILVKQEQTAMEALCTDLEIFPNEENKALEQLMSEGFTAEQIASYLLSKHLSNNGLREHTVDVHSVDSTKGFQRERRFDRNRGERAPRAGGKPQRRNDADMERVTLSIGRNDHIAPKHILGAVAGETGLPGKLMGAIEIGPDQSTIDVPKELRTRVVQAMNNATINRKRITAK